MPSRARCTVSANLQQAIGVASTTVAAGSATPAQAAATLENTMKSQSRNDEPADAGRNQ